LGRGQAIFVHLTLMPYVAASGELKTKPTQHSVKELRSIGIQPDILLVRSDREIPLGERKKIALFCNVREDAVIPALDVSSIYEVPLRYHEQGLDDQVLLAFGLQNGRDPDLIRWTGISERINKPEGSVKIAVVGKYTQLLDAYKSLSEALTHGGFANNVQVELEWIDSQIFESEDTVHYLEDVHGILVPGGFGERGAEGKIAAAKFSREHNVPYFGICFGMQMAVIEAARNLASIDDASSTEFGGCGNPVVGLLTEWMQGNVRQTRDEEDDKGGTMRLGAYACDLLEGSRVRGIYGDTQISERHRHRYEVNITYREQLEKAGLRFSGMSPDRTLPEIVELEGHPWFIGVQFHPELKSKPFAPHPLFASFIEAAVAQSRLV
jgi:CTP synthase